ncbi:MAG: hypothetical protein AAFR79_01245 [Pseudomonadota bacterium]
MTNFLRQTASLEWSPRPIDDDEPAYVEFKFPAFEFIWPIIGTSGDDTLDGGNSADIIYGNDGDDEINGNAGNDTLYGGRGGDNIDGGSGDDVIYGGDETDIIWGGSGDDWIEGGDGIDFISTGSGADVVHYDEHPTPTSYSPVGTDWLTDFELGVDRLSFSDTFLNDGIVDMADRFIAVEGAGGFGVELHAFTSFAGLEEIVYFTDLELADVQASIDDGSLFV